MWLNRADHQCGHHVATTLAWAVERDREEALSKAAQSKLYRERQAAQALKDNEEEQARHSSQRRHVCEPSAWREKAKTHRSTSRGSAACFDVPYRHYWAAER